MFSVGLSLLAAGASAQHKPGFEFSDVVRLRCADVQNQGQSGTCWCFSTMSFLESEMIANGVETPPNLSEMFAVRNNYIDRAVKYVMLAGNMTFAEGSYFWDVIAVSKRDGLVPESAMPNYKAGERQINHSRLVEATRRFADSVARISNMAINPGWVGDYTRLLDSYLPDVPSQFDYQGNTYTPKSFADSVCRLDFDDYVQITSFSHHEFNKYCMLEIPDNWRWSRFLNVPVEDLTAIIDTALQMGRTVLWAADVSESGFDAFRGYATLPGVVPTTQKAKDDFLALSYDMQVRKAHSLFRPGVELPVTQETRQIDFLNKKTTDDHGMHIIGSAVDQDGNGYYIVKNSWGRTGKYDGYFYVSKAYVRAKTTGLMVNKCVLGNRLDGVTWE